MKRLWTLLRYRWTEFTIRDASRRLKEANAQIDRNIAERF